MLSRPSVRSAGTRPRDRVIAQENLIQSWAAVRAASEYVQQLDDLVVRYDRWADSYQSAQHVLEAAMGRLESWGGSPYPAEQHFLEVVRQQLAVEFVRCLAAVSAFEWSEAQARLYEAGQQLLIAAEVMGVQL